MVELTLYIVSHISLYLFLKYVTQKTEYGAFLSYCAAFIILGTLFGSVVALVDIFFQHTIKRLSLGIILLLPTIVVFIAGVRQKPDQDNHHNTPPD